MSSKNLLKDKFLFVIKKILYKTFLSILYITYVQDKNSKQNALNNTQIICTSYFIINILNNTTL